MTGLYASPLHKAARIAYLALILMQRGVGRPKKREFDTADIARRLGVTQRSIQRDLKYAEHVAQLVRSLEHHQAG